ncbi:hypothetical protein AHAS_Ahas02G0104600 [Arachis hypogaea]
MDLPIPVVGAQSSSFLLLHTNIIEIGIFFCIKLHTEPFQCSHDSCCCKQTPPEAYIDPSLPAGPKHKPLAYLPRFGLFFLIGHPSENDMQYLGLIECQKLTKKLPRIMMWKGSELIVNMDEVIFGLEEERGVNARSMWSEHFPFLELSDKVGQHPADFTMLKLVGLLVARVLCLGRTTEMCVAEERKNASRVLELEKLLKERDRVAVMVTAKMKSMELDMAKLHEQIEYCKVRLRALTMKRDN